MSDDKEKNNVHSILEKIIKADAEYSEESYDWESGVDLSLQELTEEIDRLRRYTQKLSEVIVDLERDRKEDRRLLELLYTLVVIEGDKGHD